MKELLLSLSALLLCCAAAAQEAAEERVPPAVEVMIPADWANRDRDLVLLTDGPADWEAARGAALLSGSPWRWGVDAEAFFRNAEYFLPYTRGYTATGFFLRPYAVRQVGSHARLLLGAHLAGVAGADGLRQWKPLARLEYSPHPNLRLIMGSLYGNLSHGLLEAVFDRERYVYDRQEEGVQLLMAFPMGRCLLRSDVWLHWEELLEPWQPAQERFTLGMSNHLRLAGWESPSGAAAWGVAVPWSFLGCHRGGQFSALDTCVQSLFNETVGLRLSCVARGRFAVLVDLPLLFYQDVSPQKCLPFDRGWACWPQAACDVALSRGRRPSRWLGGWRARLHLGYWYGSRFVAPRGSYLFQSVSWHDAQFVAPEREMMTGRVALENRVGRWALGVDAQFYIDRRVEGPEDMDVAYGLYMRCAL